MAATPAANHFEEVLSARFPGIRFGRYNCRKISGSTYWSQHSWNNGRDIYPPSHISYAMQTAEYQDYLDQVNAFIVNNMEALNVRVRLWRVKNHYNHIHVDFWPRGWATPPCAGGSPRYKYPDGHEEPVARLLNEYTEEAPLNLEALIRAAFDSGNPNVRGDVNYWLELARTDPTNQEFYSLFRAMLSPYPYEPVTKEES